MPHFFLSYAQGDDDRYVELFFHELATRVGLLVGVDNEVNVGFLGGMSPYSTTEWSGSQAAALASCRTFVALASPRYFLNDNCGRQWWVFAERLRRQGGRVVDASSGLLPVQWTSTASMPAGLAAPALLRPRGGPAGAGADPAARGLRQFVRLRGLRDSYRDFVGELAQTIATHARQPAPPPYEPLPRLAATPNAFSGTVDSRIDNRPRRVHLVVAAGSRSEMDSVRTDLSYYGDERTEWAPYRPEAVDPLAARAQSIAAQRLFESVIADIERLPERVEEAHRGNEILVLLVDPWIARLEAYRRLLAEIDRRDAAVAVVLVPSSATDRETDADQDELLRSVRQVFYNGATRQDGTFRVGIHTIETFENDLVDVLEAAKNRIFREGRVHRIPQGAGNRKRPILSGP